jgi:hypothetical protein
MAALMGHLTAHAPGSARVTIMAQGGAHAVPWYEQFGFRATGPASIGMQRRL